MKNTRKNKILTMIQMNYNLSEYNIIQFVINAFKINKNFLCFAMKVFSNIPNVQNKDN